MNHRPLLLPLLLLLSLLSACSKDADDDGPTGISTPSPYAGYELELSTHFQDNWPDGTHFATASLWDPEHFWVPIDSIALNGMPLTLNQSTPNMYDLSGGDDLNVFTDVANWHVRINDTIPILYPSLPAQPFPAMGPRVSSSTLPNDEPYTFTLASMEHADSTVVVIGPYSHVMVGNETSCQFPASEIGALSLGGHTLGIITRRTQVQELGGLRIRFVKTNIRFDWITIVE